MYASEVTENAETSCHHAPFQISHFYDELFCRQRWTPLYIMIFVTGAMACLCCVALWILQLETIVMTIGYARNAIKHAICSFRS